MFANNIARQFASITFLVAAATVGTASATFAQSASSVSLYQAGYNAGSRLQSQGYTLNTLEGAPYYDTFLESGVSQSVRVSIPYAGRYVLLVGGDNDTVDLDVNFSQIGAIDDTFGRTAFIDFRVASPGDFFYTIDMLNCQAGNCGVAAFLFRIGN
jgi:hypothetical protein